MKIAMNVKLVDTELISKSVAKEFVIDIDGTKYYITVEYHYNHNAGVEDILILSIQDEYGKGYSKDDKIGDLTLEEIVMEFI